MEETKFTPGPWVTWIATPTKLLGALPNTAYIVRRDDKPDDRWVALAVTDRLQRYDERQDVETSEAEMLANARLIAASPRLYKAAWNALKIICRETCELVPGVHCTACVDLRAAIKEATGETL